MINIFWLVFIVVVLIDLFQLIYMVFLDEYVYKLLYKLEKKYKSKRN